MDHRWCAGLLIGTVSKAGAHRAQGDPRLTHRGSTEPLLETGAAGCGQPRPSRVALRPGATTRSTTARRLLTVPVQARRPSPYAVRQLHHAAQAERTKRCVITRSSMTLLVTGKDTRDTF